MYYNLYNFDTVDAPFLDRRIANEVIDAHTGYFI